MDCKHLHQSPIRRIHFGENYLLEQTAVIFLIFQSRVRVKLTEFNPGPTEVSLHKSLITGKWILKPLDQVMVPHRAN